MALERGTVISARMNIDRGNVGRLPELAAEFQLSRSEFIEQIARRLIPVGTSVTTH